MGFWDLVDKSKIQGYTGTNQKTVGSSDQGKGGFWDLVDRSKIISYGGRKTETAAPAAGQSGGWLQKGGLSNGWNIKNGIETVAGTVADVRHDLIAGILGIGEATVDAGAYLLGGIGGLLGADQFKDSMEAFIAKDILNEDAWATAVVNHTESPILNPTRKNWGFTKNPHTQESIRTEELSVLGEKADELVKSGGQLAGTIGLQAVGVPWFVTSGVTGFGSAAEGALQEGASYQEAGISAAISAGAEILTEKLFGGSGLGEKGLINLQPLTKGISGKLVKALADYGLDVAAEGAEEVISQVAGNLASALYKEESLGQLLLSEEALEGYIDSFIGGGALGGVMNAGNVRRSVKTGQDYRTELSKAEQAVFDKVYNDAVAEAQKGGKKLTSRQKAKLYDEVMGKLDKGYISIDTIEEAIGGADFAAYKKQAEQVKGLEGKLAAFQKEYDSLNGMKMGEMTGQQLDRRSALKDKLLPEIRKQLEEAQASSRGDHLKKVLSENVKKAAQGTRLAESYNEQARRGEAFAADLAGMSKAKAAVYQKAIDSGYLNNKNSTHDLVDMIAKLAEDKGVEFDFTSNQKLRESGFALDGKQVNGYRNGKSIVLNTDSGKYLNSVVGHEITHALEGTPIYGQLQAALKAYAESRGEYDSRREAVEKLYEGVSEDIDGELTAELVGDYLFTDPDFVNRLSMENRNLFQKLFDEIKYLCRIATAGSREARQLEKVKKTFEQAYRANFQAVENLEGEGVRYSLVSIDGKYYKPTDEVLIAEHPTVTAVKIQDARYQKGQKMSDAEYSTYRWEQTAKAKEHYGVYTNKDSSYSNQYGEIKAEFGQKAVNKARSYGGTAIYDILPHVGEIFENAIVLETKPDRKNDTNIRGVVDLVGSAILGDGSLAVVKLNVIEYANNEAKIYDNRVIEIEELTVVGGVGHPKIGDSTSPAVSSKYIIKAYRDFVNNQKSLGSENAPGATGWRISAEDVRYDPSYSAQQTAADATIPQSASQTAPFAQGGQGAPRGEGSGELERLNREADELSRQIEEAQKAGDEEKAMELFPKWQAAAEKAYYMQQDMQNQDGKTAQLEARAEELESEMQGAWKLGDSQTYYRLASELNEVKVELEKAKKPRAVRLTKRKARDIAGQVRKSMGLSNREMATARDIIEKYRTGEISGRAQLVQALQERLGSYTEKNGNEYLAEIQKELRQSPVKVTEDIKRGIADYNQVRKSNFGKIKFSNEGMAVDEVYYELSSQYPDYFPESIINPEDQLLRMVEVANLQATTESKLTREAAQIEEAANKIMEEMEAARQAELNSPYADRIAVLENELADKDGFISKRARTLYEEIRAIKKGERASDDLGYLLDHVGGDVGWRTIRVALLNTVNQPGSIVDKNNPMEPVVREMLEGQYREAGYELEQLQKEEDDLLSKPSYQRAVQRKKKVEELEKWAAELVGDTTCWRDYRYGVQYSTNTERRYWRDVVRDAFGNRDIQKADAIYDALQGSYNRNEALLKMESNRIKGPVRQLNMTKEESVYTQMLGELRHNPESKITPQVVEEFLEANRDKIDTAKVDTAIGMIRQIYDDILPRVNAALREYGMREIPYRQGYFPHFAEEKQGFLANLLNWKNKNGDIPTDIAGLTEQFKPNKSWQSFDKRRKGDPTDYNALKGLDMYLHGALDWIYHIGDIQKRRAVENHIRFVHSDESVKDKIRILNARNDLDANEYQEQLDLIGAEAANPLNNLVVEMRTKTNLLAGKKSSMDRGMEAMVNRRAYSTMTNLSNRVSANMVGGSISSALTNFIPITQSWGQVHPVSSVKAMAQTIRSTYKDDGTIAKSDFLTNRLRGEENLYKTTWDKIGEKVGWLMEAVDSFTSQTVWRSKYMENIQQGMSESEAIKNADQFAENVIGGRSRGNMPTIFDSKNPLIKMMTAFQLEVNNQYGYMLKDMPQDVQENRAGRLVKGYAAMFVGAYAYNALYSFLTGRDAAFDPIGILTDLLKDIFDPDEEEKNGGEIFMDFADSVLDELPFISGLTGGGRVPISSALPYDGIYEALNGTVTDISEGNWKSLTREWLNPITYLLPPVGGGQIKKTVQGLSMFNPANPVSGSYSDSGDLRFPVEETPWNVAQAAVFGQWASKNARDYIENGWLPIDEKRTIEFIASGLEIGEYRGIKKAIGAIEGDKDEDGNTINGSKKSKVMEYIADLDIDIGAKLILFKAAYKNDDTYNYEIIEYIKGLDRLSLEDKRWALEWLGFQVSEDGVVSWD